MKRLLCLSFYILALAEICSAQRYLGVATGDYSAINSMFLNPANISGSHEKIEVNLIGVNFGVDNNLGTFSQLSNIGNSNAFNVTGTQPFSMLAPMADVRLPAVMVSLNDKMEQSFAFSIRARGMIQLNHFDPNLFSTATSGDHSSSEDYDFKSNNFNMTAHAWSETGITYAIKLLDDGTQKIKVGVTLKYLGGIDYISIKGKNLDVSYTAGNDTFYAKNSDLQYASNAISTSNAVTNGINLSDVTGSLFGSKQGSGFGMDIGITYSYNINGSDNPADKANDNPDVHRLKGSVAVTDIGAINYKENNYIVNVTGNGYLTGTGLANNYNNWTNFRNYMVGQGFTADTGSKATKLYMPTALVASADYQIYQRFYVNAMFIANLANRQNFGNSYYNQISVTPRYDSRLVSVALPITYSMLADDMKLGFGFRFGGFFCGSDDILALVSSNQHGFDFYFGGYVPIFKKAPKDGFATKD
jgi:hypothetical protein